MVLSHLTIPIIMECILLAITNGNLALNGVKVAIKSYMHIQIQIQMILIALLELMNNLSKLLMSSALCTVCTMVSAQQVNVSEMETPAPLGHSR